jgi:hypothetical protein
MTELGLPPRPWSLSPGIMGILGFGGGCGSALIARRWGFSPLALAMLGSIAVPVTGTVVRTLHPSSGWLLQIGIWIAFVMLCVGIERWTAYVSPADAFRDAFGIPIPSGVGPVTVERQYFDGQLTCLAFHANAEQIAVIVSARPFKTDDTIFKLFKTGQTTWAQFWGPAGGQWVSIVKPGWPNPRRPRRRIMFGKHRQPKCFSPDCSGTQRQGRRTPFAPENEPDRLGSAPT